MFFTSTNHSNLHNNTINFLKILIREYNLTEAKSLDIHFFFFLERAILKVFFVQKIKGFFFFICFNDGIAITIVETTKYAMVLVPATKALNHSFFFFLSQVILSSIPNFSNFRFSSLNSNKP